MFQLFEDHVTRSSPNSALSLFFWRGLLFKTHSMSEKDTHIIEELLRNLAIYDPMVGTPQTCCFALFPSAPPPPGVVWCGCARAVLHCSPPPPLQPPVPPPLCFGIWVCLESGPPVVWCGSGLGSALTPSAPSSSSSSGQLLGSTATGSGPGRNAILLTAAFFSANSRDTRKGASLVRV